jgi:hypothetical protein
MNRFYNLSVDLFSLASISKTDKINAYYDQIKHEDTKKYLQRILNSINKKIWDTPQELANAMFNNENEKEQNIYSLIEKFILKNPIENYVSETASAGLTSAGCVAGVSGGLFGVTSGISVIRRPNLFIPSSSKKINNKNKLRKQ